MFSSFSISHFRGIADLHVAGLERINIFLGKNNAGKSTVMEALLLLCGATTPSLPTTVCQLRGQRITRTHPDSLWRPLFFQMDPHRPISISARWNGEKRDRKLDIGTQLVAREDLDADENGNGIATSNGEQMIHALRLNYTDALDREVVTKAKYDDESGYVDVNPMERNDYIRSTFLSARSYSSMERDARQFSHLVRIKHEVEIVQALKAIEPRIERVEVLSEPGGPAVYVDLGLPSLIPLSACGEGFVRFFSIIVEITGCRQGLLLIDEIDNGFHHSVMRELWTLLMNLCRKHDVQIVATTHNDELVTGAVDALGTDLDNLAVFRLDRSCDGHIAKRYDSEMLRAACAQNFEIRG